MTQPIEQTARELALNIRSMNPSEADVAMIMGALTSARDAAREEGAKFARGMQPESDRTFVRCWRYADGYLDCRWTEHTQNPRQGADLMGIKVIDEKERLIATIAHLTAELDGVLSSLKHVEARAAAAEGKLARAKEALAPFSYAHEKVSLLAHKGDAAQFVLRLLSEGDLRRAAEIVKELKQ